MIAINSCKYKVIFNLSIGCTMVLSGIIFTAHSANAGAYAGLAAANNATYRDVQKLGTHPKPSEVYSAQRKHFGPAYNALLKEHGDTWKKWKKAIAASMTESKEEVAELLGLDENGGPGGKAAAKGEEGPKKPQGRVNAQIGTGCDGGDCGATGAKDAKFGGKRQDNTPKVDDSGIIMEK